MADDASLDGRSVAEHPARPREGEGELTLVGRAGRVEWRAGRAHLRDFVERSKSLTAPSRVPLSSSWTWSQVRSNWPSQALPLPFDERAAPVALLVPTASLCVAPRFVAPLLRKRAMPPLESESPSRSDSSSSSRSSSSSSSSATTKSRCDTRLLIPSACRGGGWVDKQEGRASPTPLAFALSPLLDMAMNAPKGKGKGKQGGKNKASGNHHKARGGYQSKRPLGGKGIFITTIRGKESRCVGEMYDLLDEVRALSLSLHPACSSQ